MFSGTRFDNLTIFCGKEDKTSQHEMDKTYQRETPSFFSPNFSSGSFGCYFDNPDEAWIFLVKKSIFRSIAFLKFFGQKMFPRNALLDL